MWSAICTDLWQGMIDGTPVGSGSWEWVWAMIESHTKVIKLEQAREVRIRIDRAVTPTAGCKRDMENT